MRRIHRIFFCLQTITLFSLLLLLTAAPFATAHASRDWQYRILHVFCAQNNWTDGVGPRRPLLLDKHGNLYGAAADDHCGLIFEETHKNGVWKYAVIYKFDSDKKLRDGCKPNGGLIIDSKGNLYGTTSGDGGFNPDPWGTAFVLLRAHNGWKNHVLHRFSSFVGVGVIPYSGVTYAGAATGSPYDGVSPFYGVTEDGGAYSETGGTVYRLTFRDKHKYEEKILYSFCAEGAFPHCKDGSGPEAKPVLDAEGNLYGTAATGGDGGLVFKLSSNEHDEWKEDVLYRFSDTSCCKGGSYPYGGVIANEEGDLLGTTVSGGRHGNGTLYKLSRDTNWKKTALRSFGKSENDGGLPYAGLLLGKNAVYGTTRLGGTNGCGTIFKRRSSSYRVLYDFSCAVNSGKWPTEGLIAASPRKLYGVAASTASQGDAGVLFELSWSRK